MITNTEMQNILKQVNELFEAVGKRIDALEEAVKKTETKTKKSMPNKK
tara:strand:- start:585 stop:728 length:144 start_codon:yes stop_codon:yes gene_type:complete